MPFALYISTKAKPHSLDDSVASSEREFIEAVRHGSEHWGELRVWVLI